MGTVHSINKQTGNVKLPFCRSLKTVNSSNWDAQNETTGTRKCFSLTSEKAKRVRIRANKISLLIVLLLRTRENYSYSYSYIICIYDIQMNLFEV